MGDIPAVIRNILERLAGRGHQAVLVGGCALVELVEWRGPVAQWIRRQWAFVRWPLYYLLALAILFFAAFGQSAFIYQQY